MRPGVVGGVLASLTCGALMLAGANASEYMPITAPGQSGQSSAIEWRMDDLRAIGGHRVTVAGTPRVVDTDLGRAIEFNGTTDGLFLDVNPLAGLSRFTVEVLFSPAADGPPEQRFVHFEEAKTGNRALIELRLLQGPSWCLDTYLRHGEAALTLIDREKTHPAAGWHIAALVYDGKTMTHYVDGVREMTGDVSFSPLGAGTSSIGVRQNRVSWFKGRIHTIRVTPAPLDAARFLRASRPQAESVREGRVIPIWPEGVPGAKPNGGERRVVDGRVYNVREPTLSYVAPEPGGTAGTAVIICPGGGYARLAIANEAAGVAARLHALGVATFILEYRLTEYGHPAPLQDILRAIRFVRSRASDLGIRPDRIGVMGASAGGHVAAAAATLFDAPEGRTGAALDATSARPDFVGLLYPVITMREPFAHLDSRTNLLGANPPESLVSRMSLETQVTKDTPPVFIVHTAEDKSVPLENSVLFYQALRGAGVSAELHLYERGPHGFGMTQGLGPASEWFERLAEWMRAHGWLDESRRNVR